MISYGWPSENHHSSEKIDPAYKMATANWARKQAVAWTECSPHPMMVINQGGITGFERCFAQIPPADFLQSFQRGTLGALRHGSRAEIGGMRGNGGKKCGIRFSKGEIRNLARVGTHE